MSDPVAESDLSKPTPHVPHSHLPQMVEEVRMAVAQANTTLTDHKERSEFLSAALQLIHASFQP